MQTKKELIHSFAAALVSYGYKVWLSGSKEFGFYSDGKRCISFGGYWNFSVNVSGNWRNVPGGGTGFTIGSFSGPPTAEQAAAWLKDSGRFVSGYEYAVFDTPEQHLKTYGKACEYAPFEPEAGDAQTPSS